MKFKTFFYISIFYVFRNGQRRDDVVCEGKCRYETLCALRKGHHNMALCDHLPSYRFPNFKENPKESAGISKYDKAAHTVIKQQLEEQQHEGIAVLLKKSLRSYIMKRFLQLFVLFRN